MLILERIRCPKCNKRLMDLHGTAQISCPRCKSIVEVDTELRKIYVKDKAVKKEG